MSENVFVYWDNSNIFYEAQYVAGQREQLGLEGPDASFRVRINFENMLELAHAGRTVEKAVVAGSITPETRRVWGRMKSSGIKVELYDRGAKTRGEQNVPDKTLQLEMLKDAFDNLEEPCTVVLLTGDGGGYDDDAGFHSVLERLHRRKFRIEVLSWKRACNQRMRQFVEENGAFVALDDFYEAITFMKDSNPGFNFAAGRNSFKPDLTLRKKA